MGDCATCVCMSDSNSAALEPKVRKSVTSLTSGLDGDEARRGASEAVLGVDPFCGVEDAVADIHRDRKG